LVSEHQGEANLRVATGRGNLTHGFCGLCGGGVYQCPKDATFRALFPSTFNIEDPVNDKCCALPTAYHPTVHVNYENRHIDCHDPLPKYLVWQTGLQVNNDGSPIQL
jgi:hypothetical protein